VVLSERYEKISCQGRRSDIRQEIEIMSGKKSAPTCGHNVHKLKSRDDIGEEYGLTGRSIARYMRLNYLIEPLKESLDNGEIALIAAVDLSYLDEKEQKLLADQIQWGGAKVSQKTARRLRESSGSLEGGKVAEVMAPAAGTAKTFSIRIPVESGEVFFGKNRKGKVRSRGHGVGGVVLREGGGLCLMRMI
jgi:ParB family chromosome partitioning protein